MQILDTCSSDAKMGSLLLGYTGQSDAEWCPEAYAGLEVHEDEEVRAPKASGAFRCNLKRLANHSQDFETNCTAMSMICVGCNVEAVISHD